MFLNLCLRSESQGIPTNRFDCSLLRILKAAPACLNKNRNLVSIRLGISGRQVRGQLSHYIGICQRGFLK